MDPIWLPHWPACTCTISLIFFVMLLLFKKYLKRTVYGEMGFPRFPLKKRPADTISNSYRPPFIFLNLVQDCGEGK